MSARNNKFPIGLRVLAVDDDYTSLSILKTMLNQCEYNVTVTTRGTAALNMLRENKGGYDIIISDVHMPDMDGFKLLELVTLEMDLPVVMVSGNVDADLVMKGVIRGACDFLLKPARLEELKNVWQHVVRRKKFGPNKERNYEDACYKILSRNAEAPPARNNNDPHEKFNKKRKDQNGEEDDQLEELNNNEDDNNEDSSTQKKPRVVWSGELHRKFLDAVEQIGIDKAVPKKILELMKVENLTRENVASHLQKYRQSMKRREMVKTSSSSGSLYQQVNYMTESGNLLTASTSRPSKNMICGPFERNALERLNIRSRLGHGQTSINAAKNYGNGSALQSLPASSERNHSEDKGQFYTAIKNRTPLPASTGFLGAKDNIARSSSQIGGIAIGTQSSVCMAANSEFSSQFPNHGFCNNIWSDTVQLSRNQFNRSSDDRPRVVPPYLSQASSSLSTGCGKESRSRVARTGTKQYNVSSAAALSTQLPSSKKMNKSSGNIIGMAPVTGINQYNVSSGLALSTQLPSSKATNSTSQGWNTTFLAQPENMSGIAPGTGINQCKVSSAPASSTQLPSSKNVENPSQGQNLTQASHLDSISDSLNGRTKQYNVSSANVSSAQFPVAKAMDNTSQDWNVKRTRLLDHLGGSISGMAPSAGINQYEISSAIQLKNSKNMDKTSDSMSMAPSMGINQYDNSTASSLSAQLPDSKNMDNITDNVSGMSSGTSINQTDVSSTAALPAQLPSAKIMDNNTSRGRNATRATLPHNFTAITSGMAVNQCDVSSAAALSTQLPTSGNIDNKLSGWNGYTGSALYGPSVQSGSGSSSVPVKEMVSPSSHNIDPKNTSHAEIMSCSSFGELEYFVDSLFVNHNEAGNSSVEGNVTGREKPKEYANFKDLVSMEDLLMNDPMK